jgi:hypothetical protein
MKTKRKTRRLPLFTQDDFPELDSLKIQWDLMQELTPRMRVANLEFIASKMGFRLLPTRF